MDSPLSSPFPTTFKFPVSLKSCSQSLHLVKRYHRDKRPRAPGDDELYLFLLFLRHFVLVERLKSMSTATMILHTTRWLCNSWQMTHCLSLPFHSVPFCSLPFSPSSPLSPLPPLFLSFSYNRKMIYCIFNI